MKKTTPPPRKAVAAPDFAVGERVTYYPRHKSSDDNTHFSAEVLSFSKTGRPRVKFVVHQIGECVRTVSPRALVRQNELPI